MKFRPLGGVGFFPKDLFDGVKSGASLEHDMIARLPISKVDKKSWSLCIVSYGLVFGIVFVFSLYSQPESGTAKLSYSSIAKVKKDFKRHHSKPLAVLTLVLADWAPTFHACFHILREKQNFLDGHLLDSKQSRAPPSNYSH